MRGKEIIYLLYKSGATDCIYLSREELRDFIRAYKQRITYVYDSFEQGRAPFGLDTSDISGWKVADGNTEFYTKKLEFPKEYINAFDDKLSKIQKLQGNDLQRVDGIEPPAKSDIEVEPPTIVESVPELEVNNDGVAPRDAVTEVVLKNKVGEEIVEYWADDMKFIGKNWDNPEADRLFLVECKCGQSYHRKYAYNATKEGCAYCKEITFTDRNKGYYMIGKGKHMGIGQLMTNRYFVDRTRR